jgi:AcrR family transcriptional regulator
MPHDQPRRTYDSSGRRARAKQTRQEVVRTAHRLFLAKGFAHTTVAEIAREARVSAPTVYASFGSKAALLRAAIELALAGDLEPVAVADRPLSRWVHEAGTARELLRRYATMMGELGGRTAAIYAVLVAAADGDAELAELVAEFERQRLRAATTIAEAVRDRDGLPPGRSLAEARDTIWLCTDPLLHVSLTRKRRWSEKRYVVWAEETLVKLVLEPPLDGARS